jgi:hypothetical protein
MAAAALEAAVVTAMVAEALGLAAVTAMVVEALAPVMESVAAQR